MLHDGNMQKTNETAQSLVSKNGGCGFYTVLPTAIIGVIAESGDVVKCRALLDSGSQSSFITEKCSRIQKLTRHHEHLTLTGIGNNLHQLSKASANLNFKSIKNDKIFYVKAFVLPKLTGILPNLEQRRLSSIPKMIQP